MSTHLWQGTWRGRSPNGTPHQRAREIVRPTGGIVRGKFPSRKNGRMVEHEGLLELDAIYLFEVLPSVVAFTEQPKTVTYPDGDQVRRYTPDFELILRSGEKLLVEVKPSERLKTEAVAHKIDAIQRRLERDNEQLMVLTEESLRREPRQSNARDIVYQAPRIAPEPLLLSHILRLHSAQFPLSLAEVTALLAPAGVSPLSLFLAGLVWFDLDTPLSANTVLTIAEGEEHGHVHFAAEL